MVVVVVGVAVAVVVAVAVAVVVVVGVVVVVVVVVGVAVHLVLSNLMRIPDCNCESCGLEFFADQLTLDCGELVCGGCKETSDAARAREAVAEFRAIASEWFATGGAERRDRYRWAEGYFGFQRRAM